MKQCPICKTTLSEIDYHKERVDFCPDCGGSFYDKGELDKIIGMFELYEAITLNEAEIDTLPIIEKQREVLCPKDQQPMEPLEIAGQIIDRCPQCQGIWLDKGEIVALKIAENHIRENMNLYIRLGH
ncbi:MAG: zf-TFIIB domain-containing protein [Spirochaetales bacterium]|nr:zf-TFIIB domain-containing protein [Spirochaetales bacterium]